MFRQTKQTLLIILCSDLLLLLTLKKILFNRLIFYDGLTLYPFVILKHKELLHDKSLLNHEQIHLRQQAELLVAFFYFLYVLNYILNLVRYRNHSKAYRNIIFEREAFANEKKTNYLSTRKRFAFVYYFTNQ